ncbi:proline-rich protein 36-like, partial [Thrips palmi]|uniref:Proline-rich protein 36-like n=1 Tax=Thrips palmi TaxID=161013 RepID=A0A6P8ZBF9_THRPL
MHQQALVAAHQAQQARIHEDQRRILEHRHQQQQQQIAADTRRLHEQQQQQQQRMHEQQRVQPVQPQVQRAPMNQAPRPSAFYSQPPIKVPRRSPGGRSPIAATTLPGHGRLDVKNESKPASSGAPPRASPGPASSASSQGPSPGPGSGPGSAPSPSALHGAHPHSLAHHSLPQGLPGMLPGLPKAEPNFSMYGYSTNYLPPAGFSLHDHHALAAKRQQQQQHGMVADSKAGTVIVKNEAKSPRPPASSPLPYRVPAPAPSSQPSPAAHGGNHPHASPLSAPSLSSGSAGRQPGQASEPLSQLPPLPRGFSSKQSGVSGPAYSVTSFLQQPQQAGLQNLPGYNTSPAPISRHKTTTSPAPSTFYGKPHKPVEPGAMGRPASPSDTKPIALTTKAPTLPQSPYQPLPVPLSEPRAFIPADKAAQYSHPHSSQPAHKPPTPHHGASTPGQSPGLPMPAPSPRSSASASPLQVQTQPLDLVSDKSHSQPPSSPNKRRSPFQPPVADNKKPRLDHPALLPPHPPHGVAAQHPLPLQHQQHLQPHHLQSVMLGHGLGHGLGVPHFLGQPMQHPAVGAMAALAPPAQHRVSPMSPPSNPRASPVSPGHTRASPSRMSPLQQAQQAQHQAQGLHLQPQHMQPQHSPRASPLPGGHRHSPNPLQCNAPTTLLTTRSPPPVPVPVPIRVPSTGPGPGPGHGPGPGPGPSPGPGAPPAGPPAASVTSAPSVSPSPLPSPLPFQSLGAPPASPMRPPSAGRASPSSFPPAPMPVLSPALRDVAPTASPTPP